MKTVKTTITYVEKASRFEILVRIVYAIAMGIVYWVLSTIAIFAGIAVPFYSVFGKEEQVSVQLPSDCSDIRVQDERLHRPADRRAPSDNTRLISLSGSVV